MRAGASDLGEVLLALVRHPLRVVTADHLTRAVVRPSRVRRPPRSRTLTRPSMLSSSACESVTGHPPPRGEPRRASPRARASGSAGAAWPASGGLDAEDGPRGQRRDELTHRGGRPRPAGDGPAPPRRARPPDRRPGPAPERTADLRVRERSPADGRRSSGCPPDRSRCRTSAGRRHSEAPHCWTIPDAGAEVPCRREKHELDGDGRAMGGGERRRPAQGCRPCAGARRPRQWRSRSGRPAPAPRGRGRASSTADGPFMRITSTSRTPMPASSTARRRDSQSPVVAEDAVVDPRSTGSASA